jgi:hypothetical protein
MRRALFVLAMAAACSGARSNANVVNGVALDSVAQPIAFARVRIGTLPVATTDANGRFSIANVPATYDAALIVQVPASQFAPAMSAAAVYQGLTRRDPVLWLPRRVASPSWNLVPLYADSLAVSGAANGPGGLFVLIDALGNQHPQSCCSGSPLYVMFAYGDPALPATLVALRANVNGFVDAGARVLAASGHLVVPRSAAVGSFTVPVSAAPSFTISGTASVPSGCTLTLRLVVPPLRPNDYPILAQTFTAQTPSSFSSFTYDVGWTDEVPLMLSALAQCSPVLPGGTSTVARVRRDKTSYTLTVPPMPELTAPASGSLLYSWTAPPSALSLAIFTRLDANGYETVKVWVVTAGTSAAIPDLTPQVPAQPSQSYGPEVRVYDGLSSADAAASSPGLHALLTGVLDSSYSWRVGQ